jgi:hypothetical protein
LISGLVEVDLVLFLLLMGLAVDGDENGVGRGWGGRSDGIDHGRWFLEGNVGVDASIVRRGMDILCKGEGMKVPLG